ncbi:unnamed protein product [Rhizoctonia solani]|uniref:Uncharacterized protein n=1 Tax=Rhizoctonia solani TaxID=456999 RepID=A0A8H3H3Q9_9AGAM|nr:unnamed protein product [Rhizoctonia solani]
MEHYRVLRFMQRGTTQRVTATTAKVIDEAQWDIGPAARAAWGVSSSANSDSVGKVSSIYVTRDDSYLPFVFDRGIPDAADQQPLGDESEAEPARRRIFRKGTEVKHEICSADATSSSNEPEKIGTKAESDTKANGSLDSTKAEPKSISGPRNPNKAPLTHQPGMRRHRLEEFLKPSAPATTGFLKPSGVSSASGTRTKRAREDNIAAPRGKTTRVE